MNKKITPKGIATLETAAREAVVAVAEKFGEGRRGGGYIYICDSLGRKWLHVKIGYPDPEKEEKYKEFSQEKAERLLANPEHKLSWQSRNPEDNKWGGAVRLGVVGGFIISFSGFPEAVDEAFCISIAQSIGWIDSTKAFRCLLNQDKLDLFSEVHSVVIGAVKVTVTD